MSQARGHPFDSPLRNTEYLSGGLYTPLFGIVYLGARLSSRPGSLRARRDHLTDPVGTTLGLCRSVALGRVAPSSRGVYLGLLEFLIGPW